MATHDKKIMSRKDNQGHRKILKKSDIRQQTHGQFTGQTQSTPQSIGQVFPGKRLVADGNGRAHLVPAMPDVPAVFHHLMQALLSQGLRFLDIGRNGEGDSLKLMLSGLMQLDKVNYDTSDPERLRQEMKSNAKHGPMSDILFHATQKDIETSAPFPGSSQKILLPRKEAGTLSEKLELMKVDGDVLTNTRDKMGSTILHHAAINGQRDLAKALQGGDIVAIKDKLDRTALHMAALVGDREMILLLADSKDIDTRDMFGKTSLYLAAEKGHTEIVTYLMELGAKPDTVDMFGFSPLFAAIRGRSLETVKLLLSKDVVVNRQCLIGATPIHFAAVNGDIDTVSVLLDSGAKANIGDKMEGTPLILAARGSHVDVCFKLLEKYTAEDVRKANMEGLQAIHFAVASSKLELVKKLIEHGADTVTTISEIGLTLLHFAVIFGNFAIVSFLVNEAKVDVNTADKCGSTPLHAALRGFDIDVVHLLLERGAKANVPDKHGIQAIHVGVVYHDVDLVKTLIENGAELDAMTEDGRTPLHVAVCFRNLPVISFLVKEANVDVNVVDRMMYTPMDLAEAKGDKECVSLLKHCGGKRSQLKKTALVTTTGQTLAYVPQVTASSSAVPQTPPETENPGHSSVASEIVCTEDQRLRPILMKADVEKMLNDLKKLLEDAGDEALTQKNIVFSQRNFAMGVIGPKGGKLAFADESVTMTIPPDALSDTRVISCFRPVSLNIDDQGRQPDKDWIFCTPELICGPDGTKFNKPITIRFRHSIHVSEDGSCRAKNVRVVTKGDKEEQWQDEDEVIRFDGRWVDINVAHFTSISCAIPRQEAPSDDRFDVLMSTGLTVVPGTQPEGAQAMVPGTPSHLHVFITNPDVGQMQDLKQGRLATMPNNEVSRINQVIGSINPRLDLRIEGHPHAFRLSNGNPITVQLNRMVNNHVTHGDVAIAETNEEDMHLDVMLILEPDQTDGTSRSVIEHSIWRTDYSRRVPRQNVIKGSLADKLDCYRKTIPRRPLVPYPIEQGVIPHLPGLQQIQEEVQPPPEQQLPVMPLADQIAVQLGQIADQVAALQAQYALLLDVHDH